jgi:hypothetical protein
MLIIHHQDCFKYNFQLPETNLTNGEEPIRLTLFVTFWFSKSVFKVSKSFIELGQQKFFFQRGTFFISSSILKKYQVIFAKKNFFLLFPILFVHVLHFMLLWQNRHFD